MITTIVRKLIDNALTNVQIVTYSDGSRTERILNAQGFPVSVVFYDRNGRRKERA